MATGFSTYMTGEFFNLLSTKSILSVTVQEGAGFTEQQNTLAFKKGVSDSVRSNLLHASFLVRTNHLFKKLSAEENYYYLSGLLIGTELKELTGKKAVSICLVASKALQPLYHTALQVLQLAENLKMENPDEAIARGHSRIYNLHKGQLS
jgi:2-dehydro-3-deoxygalactonokinase